MELRSTLEAHLHDSNSSFSIGCMGAIAEFHRDPHEAASVTEAGLTVVTARGAIRIDCHERMRPRAYETLSRASGGWQHGVSVRLPEHLAAPARRETITELGPDQSAVRDEDREALLFDMGLCAPNIDFHVRTADEDLIRVLRAAAGRSVLEAGSEAMAAIIERSPHRVACSGLGRVEVFQAIGRTHTPSGPHTHVLPKLLASGCTESANIPETPGYLPCLTLYPPHPLSSNQGEPRAFDPVHYTAFQQLLAVWGDPMYLETKQRVTEAVRGGRPAATFEAAHTRIVRTAVRVTLRQLAAAGGHDGVIEEWVTRFEPSSPETGENQPVPGDGALRPKSD